MRSLILGIYTLFLLSVPVTSAEIPAIGLQEVHQHYKNPVLITNDGSSDALYVLEQKGRICVIDDGQQRLEPLLDIIDRVEYGGECGLLGLAFHPNYASNGKFYVNYTTKKTGDLHTFVSEFTADPKSFRCDPASERLLLRFKQPWSNHNGGGIVFGPDRKFYIATGDGGAGGDPKNSALNLTNPLGKILRIDVDKGNPYSIPTDNPFAHKSDCLKEIWAYGLRNPWRFSFDRKTGMCYAGDVGQNKVEEIDIIERGKNYGWSAREGFRPFKPERGHGEMQDPIKEYERDLGVSVTGGYVYRGSAIPALEGIYLYGDYQSGRIWGLKYENSKLTFDEELLKADVRISSFGEDRSGELYVCSHGDGKIYKIVAK